MKINSKDFRVREGHEVDLKKWPMKVDPVYKSKEQYKNCQRSTFSKIPLLVDR